MDSPLLKTWENLCEVKMTEREKLENEFMESNGYQFIYDTEIRIKQFIDWLIEYKIKALQEKLTDSELKEIS